MDKLKLKAYDVDPLKISKCIASTYIPKTTTTTEFSYKEIQLISHSNEQIVNLLISPLGFLCANSNSESHSWIRHARVAQSVHDQNAILIRRDNLLTLKVVKNIEKNQELMIWFSDDVQLIMQISFLNLHHIQGT